MKTSPRWTPAAFGAAALTFLLLDAVWLWNMADLLYRPLIGHVMRPDFDVGAAALFYVIYLAGVVGFVVHPATGTPQALLRGACFGLVCYATYDLTNQATVQGWPWLVTVVDLCWGAAVTAAAGGVSYRLTRGLR